MLNYTFILDVSWDVQGMPNLVGPFETTSEAEEFARINVPNGTWQVRPVAYPFTHRGPEIRLRLASEATA